MRIQALTLIVLSAVLAGCATSQTDKELDTSKVERIVDGETTKSEIAQWFGQPTAREPTRLRRVASKKPTLTAIPKAASMPRALSRSWE